MLEVAIITVFCLLGVITQRVVGFGIAPFLSPVALIFFAPPVAMWLRTHTSTPDQIRQNIAAMFIVVNTCSLTTIYLLKPATYNYQLATNFAVLVPAVLLGNVIGYRLIRHVNVKLYEKLVVAAIILTGLVSIILGTISLLS